jgi:hypothetical protein
MKKQIYIALGILAVLAVVIQIFGGFKAHSNPVVRAVTPPPLVKEAPPPELLKPSQAAPDFRSRSPEAARPAVKAEPKPTVPAQSNAAAPPAAPEAASQARGPRLVREMPPAARARGEAPAPAARSAVEPGPTAAELARQESARQVVLDKSPALAKLITEQDGNTVYRGWKAEEEGGDSYRVTFTFLDQGAGTPMQYVWKVNLTSRTIQPLSYYSRKLP